MSFRLKGIREVQRKLKQIAQDMDGNRIPQALRAEAENVMTDSKKNYVPVDKGALRSSGKVGKVDRSGNNFKVELSYGGIAAPYALAIHEHLSQHSPPSWKAAQSVTFHPQGHGPKYLETPLKNKQSTLAQDLAKRLRLS